VSDIQIFRNRGTRLLQAVAYQQSKDFLILYFTFVKIFLEVSHSSLNSFGSVYKLAFFI